MQVGAPPRKKARSPTDDKLLVGKQLALTVSMYSDFVDLRATGAGRIDMFACHLLLLLLLLLLAARVSHALHVNSFHTRTKFLLGFNAGWCCSPGGRLQANRF